MEADKQMRLCKTTLPSGQPLTPIHVFVARLYPWLLLEHMNIPVSLKTATDAPAKTTIYTAVVVS